LTVFSTFQPASFKAVDAVAGKAQPFRLVGSNRPPFTLLSGSVGGTKWRSVSSDSARLFGGGVALDDFGDVALLAHHALRRVEGHALAVVVERQHGEIMPALQRTVGQHRRVQRQHRARLDVVAHALRQRLRQRHQALQAVRQQQLRHAHLVVGGQQRRLRHQRLQVGQRDRRAALVQLQHAAGQVVDVPRRIGRQHVVDLVGAVCLAPGGACTCQPRRRPLPSSRQARLASRSTPPLSG
jgi:hypothetical protein